MQLFIERSEAWRRLVSKIGRRYECCRAKDWTFHGSDEDQRQQATVLASVQTYLDDLPDRMERGENVIAFGPVGGGKDFFAAGMMRTAVLKYGLSCWWVNGLDFFGDMRDQIGHDGTERDILRGLIAADILVMSDPLPVAGTLTPYQINTLFRVVDARYRNLRPTWLTVNCLNLDDAAASLGVPTFSRLTENALGLHCNWADYRGGK